MEQHKTVQQTTNTHTVCALLLMALVNGWNIELWAEKQHKMNIANQSNSSQIEREKV